MTRGRTGMRKAKRHGVLAAILFVGLTLRLALTFAVPSTSLLEIDGPDYREIADHLARGEGYSISGYRWFEPKPVGYSEALARNELPLRPELCRPPLLPFTGAFFHLLPGEWIVHARIAAAVTGALSILVVYGLAASLFGSTSGLVAGGLMAFYPYSLHYSTRWSTENLALVFLWTATWLWIRRADAGKGAIRSMGSIALAGAALGLSALARPNMLLIAVAVVSFGVYKLGRRGVVALAALLFVLAPWTAHNASITGVPNPATFFGPYNMWLGNNDAMYEMYIHPFTDRFRQEQARQNDALSRSRVKELEESGTYGIREVNQFWTRECLRYWREEPRKAATILLMRAGHYFQPIPTPAVSSWGEIAISAFSMIPLMFLAGLAWRRDRRAREPILGVIIFAGLLAALPFTFSIRMRYPVLDPVLVALGAHGLVILLGDRLRRTGPRHTAGNPSRAEAPLLLDDQLL